MDQTQKPLTLDDINNAIDLLNSRIVNSNNLKEKTDLTAQRQKFLDTRRTLLKINNAKAPKITEASYTGENQKAKMNKIKNSRLKVISIIIAVGIALGAAGFIANKIENNFRDNIKVTETLKSDEPTTLSAYQEKALFSDQKFQMEVLDTLNSTLDYYVREELDTKVKDIVAEENPNMSFTPEELKRYNYSFELATSENGFDVSDQNDCPYVVWLQFENNFPDDWPCNPRYIIPSEKAQEMYVAYSNLQYLLNGYDYINEFGYSDEGVAATSEAKTKATSEAIKNLAELVEKYGIKVPSIDGQDFAKLVPVANEILAEQNANEKSDEGR